MEAIALDHPVLVVEGERKVDLLASWNIAATCNAGGAKKWKLEHAEFLRGADVVLVPDNDDSSWQQVDIVGASLVGVAKRIRVLVLPYANAKDDVVDWANAGGTREQLGALLDEAKDWQQQTSTDQAEHDDEKAKAKAHEDELLAALAQAKGLDYDRQRKAAAEELHVSARAIDDEVKARREDAGSRRSMATGSSSRGRSRSTAIRCCATSSNASSGMSSSPTTTLSRSRSGSC